MEHVYHGSRIPNLKCIKPRVSTHLQNLVYATKSPCIATIFLNKGGSDLFYALGGEGTTENPVYLVERIPGIFDRIFQGSGSIYKLNGKEFSNRTGFWSAEVVAEGEREVLEEEKVTNILDRLKEFESDGKLRLYKYPERPEFIPLDNSDLIDKYICFYEMGHQDSINQLLTYYPEFTEEVHARLNNKHNKIR